jgi:hypothetical protein
MLNAVLYWLAVAAFLFVGAAALVRPETILGIRAKFRPFENAEHVGGVRRKRFGPVQVRICGVALLVIGAALILSLLA